MKVHIFKDENVYVLSLLEFLGRNFDISGHLFIFRCKDSGKKLAVASDSVRYLPGYGNLIKIRKIVKDSDRVYFHLLPSGPDILFWYLNKRIFSKAVWIFWGADIYESRIKNKDLKHFIYHLVRKDIIGRIPDIAGFLKGDYEFIRKEYRTGAHYHHVVYPIPTKFTLCDELLKEPAATGKSNVNVLLGNSGNESNRHHEAIKILEKYRQENMTVTCPLSYGSKKKSYVQSIMDYGKEAFGPNFIPLVEFIQPDDYLKLLNGVDIAVMNHDRQQGLGNSLSLLYLGKKVFLRKDTTSYDYFTEKKIVVYDIDSIRKLPFDEFKNFGKSDGNNNREILKEEFSDEAYRRNWKHILEL